MDTGHFDGHWTLYWTQNTLMNTGHFNEHWTL